MRSYVFGLTLIVVAINGFPLFSHSQAVISGRMEIKGATQYMVYLSNFDDFEMAKAAFDSSHIDAGGNFSIKIARINAPLQMVRLTVSESASGQFYLNQDGIHDNSILLPVSNKSAIYLKADADSLFYSARFPGNKNLNLLFQKLRSIKEPLKERVRVFREESKNLNRKEKDSLISRYVDTAKVYGNSQKIFLSKLIDGENNIYNITYALYEYFMANGNSYDDIFLKEVVGRSICKLPVFENIKRRIVIYGKEHLKNVMDSATFFSLGPWKDWTGSKGGNTILIFWASWCGPCRQSIQTTIKDLYSRAKQKGIQFISISVDQKPEPAKAAFKSDGAGWPQFIDKNRIFDNLEFRFIPVYITYSKKDNAYAVFRDFIEAFRSLDAPKMMTIRQ
jgi:thiol-disulfide isomerase/thioredoxin